MYNLRQPETDEAGGRRIRGTLEVLLRVITRGRYQAGRAPPPRETSRFYSVESVKHPRYGGGNARQGVTHATIEVHHFVPDAFFHMKSSI